MVLPLLAAACLAAAGGASPPPPDDAVVFVQRAVEGGKVLKRWQSRLFGRTSTFKAGENLEFRAAGARWLNCTVLAEDEKADTYTIRVPALPAGHQELSGIQASLLRDPRKEAAREAERKQAERRAEEERRRREAREVLLFEEREDVLLMGKGKGAGKWFKGRILHPGAYPGTYDVKLDNGILIKSAEATSIKKTHDMHYEACETVDLKDANGKLWRTKVLGPGSDIGTVDIRNPYSPEPLRNIPVLALRKVRKANATGESSVGGGANGTSAASGMAGPGVDGAQAAAAEPVVPALLAIGAEVVEAETNATNASQAFEAGQSTWVQLNDTDESKPWVRGMILREGDLPGTYDLRVTSKIPSYDLCDVPAARLLETEETILAKAEEAARKKAEEEAQQRAAEEAERKKAEEAAQQARERGAAEEEARARAKQQAMNKVLSVAAYRPGQELQFNSRGSQWVNCTVLSLAAKPHTYDIFVPGFPEGLQEITGVHAKVLRSFEEAAQLEAEKAQAPRKLAEEAQAKRQQEHAFEPQERVQVQIKGKTNSWADAIIKAKGSEPGWYVAEVEGNPVRLHSSVLRRDPDHTFEDGEVVQIRTAGSNAWVPCTVTRKGEVPGTYNIYFAAGPVGHRDMHNIDARGLHRIKYHIGQPVEVFMQRGPSKGMWIESQITSLVAGKADTYSVHIFDSPYEFNISQVAYRNIRRSEAQIAKTREKLQFQAQVKEDERLRREKEQKEAEEFEQSHTFKEGECVQVESQNKSKGNMWINMTILRKGTVPNTYHLSWKESYFWNVKRDIIRKDPARQAKKEQREEEARKQADAEEAEHKAAILARARRAEEEIITAARHQREIEDGRAQAEVEAEEEDIEIVSPETIARLEKEARQAMEREQAEQLAAIQRQKQKAFDEEVEEQEDFAKRKAEWEDILRDVDGEEETEEAPAANASQTATQPEQAAAQKPMEPGEEKGSGPVAQEETSSEKQLEGERQPKEKNSEEEQTEEKKPALEQNATNATEAAKEPVRKKTAKELEKENAQKREQRKKEKAKERELAAKRGVWPAESKKLERKGEEQKLQPHEVTWSMDAETAKRQAEWEAMVAEEAEEQNQDET